MRLASALAPIVDFVFPPRCPLCGDPVAVHGGLCLGCWGKLVVPSGTCCTMCQRPMGEAHGAAAELVCAPCMAEPPRLWSAPPAWQSRPGTPASLLPRSTTNRRASSSSR